MLDDHDIAFTYREYRQEPLSVEEILAVLKKLGVGPRDMLRPRDKAFMALGLSGNEPDARLVELMAEHPTLLQRPIGVMRERAVVGRPVENLLDLVR